MDMNDLLEEREQQESGRKRSFAFRLNIFFFTVFLLFSVLIVRLAFMQFVEGRELSEQIGQTYTRTLPVAPIRGNILTAKGRRSPIRLQPNRFITGWNRIAVPKNWWKLRTSSPKFSKSMGTARSR